MTHISVISPVYKANNIISELVNRISITLSTISSDYEIILVDDNCPDDSWSLIKTIAAENKKVKGFKLSRNFGQHYAITAGLQQAKGDWVVVMDCDLQDVPEEIPKLYNKATEGYDIVLAARQQRQDSFLKMLSSKLFYGVLGYLTGVKQDSRVANFGIYSKKVIKSIVEMPESIRYFPTMVKWVGFKRTTIPVKHSDRAEGKSSYNFKRLINLALDIMLAYSDKPIRLTIKFGLFISLISFAFVLITFYKYLIGDILVLGYSSLIISIWFLSGALMVVLGVIGLYVGKTFEGVKKRPHYIIDEITD